MSSEVLISMIGVIVAIVLVIVMSLKGISALMGAVIGAGIILATSGLDVVTGLTQDYAQGFATQVTSVIMMYYATCMFACIMNATYSMQSVAEFISSKFGVRYSCTALVVIGFLLRLGGMDKGVYLILFDIGLIMLSKANYSEDIIFALITGSCMTFACSSPFFPSTHNNLVMNAWGTDSMAGLVPGLVSLVVEVVLTIGFLEWLVRKWQKQGRGFKAWNLVKTGEELEAAKKQYPNIVIAVIPFAMVIILYNVFQLHICVCCTIAALVATLLNVKKYSFQEWLSVWAKGFKDAIPMVAAISAMTGLGAIVRLTPFFAYIFEVMANSTLNPLILLFASGSVITMAVGSAGSAVTLSLSTLEPLVENWRAAGYNLGTMHRVLVKGAIWPSMLPTNGIVGALNEICHTDCKRSYMPAAVVGIVVPFIGGVVTLALAMMGL